MKSSWQFTLLATLCCIAVARALAPQVHLIHFGESGGGNGVAKPGEPQYYLLADADTSHVGPTDELTRTQRSFFKKLWKHTGLGDIFGGCNNCCNNNNNYDNNYDVGNGDGYYPPPPPPQPPQDDYYNPGPFQAFPPLQPFHQLPPFKALQPLFHKPMKGFGGFNTGGGGGKGFGSGYNNRGYNGGGSSNGGYNAPSGGGGYGGGSPSSGYGGSGYKDPQYGGNSGGNVYGGGSSADSENSGGGYPVENSDAAYNGESGKAPADSEAYNPTNSNGGDYGNNKPAQTYTEPVAPTYEEPTPSGESDYAKPPSAYSPASAVESTPRKPGYNSVPQILYQPIIYVSPQYQPQSRSVISQDATVSNGESETLEDKSNYEAPEPESPVGDASKESEESSGYEEPTAKDLTEYSEQKNPAAVNEPKAPPPMFSPAPPATGCCSSPLCAYPGYAIPYYGYTPQVAPMYSPPYAHSPYNSVAGAGYGSPQQPLTNARYNSGGPAMMPPPVPQQAYSPAPQLMNNPPTPVAQPVYNPATPANTSPQGMTFSTIYTVISQPSASQAPQLSPSPQYSNSNAVPTSGYGSSSSSPALGYVSGYSPAGGSSSSSSSVPQPQPNHYSPPLPAAHIHMTEADQPYRVCPELFAEYKYQLENNLAYAKPASSGNTYVNTQVIGLGY